MHTHKSYITGFIISIVLTLGAYFAVVNQFSNVAWVILSLALIQLIVQMVFFLHVGQGPDSRWNLAVFLSTLSVIFILVAGSLWIMKNLNYNMTPGQMNDYMIKQENIFK